MTFIYLPYPLVIFGKSGQSEHPSPDFPMRHEEGDWGEVCAEDRESNERALTSGRRIFSVYECGPAHQEYGQKIYVVMEADRSVTTAL